MDTLRTTMIAQRTACRLLRDVAAVSGRHQPRLGIAGQDGDNDIVEGIVLMRRGEQSCRPSSGRGGDREDQRQRYPAAGCAHRADL